MATDMDLDIVVDSAGPSTKVQARKTTSPILVDDDHPFDLEVYISQYTGKAAVQRLIHIASVCPPLAPAAYLRAIEVLRQSREPHLYVQMVQNYNALPSVKPEQQIEADKLWLDEVHAQNISEKNKLEVELKTYSSNMIKESIRMAHNDLGNYYRLTGDQSNSLKHYTKSREFCTSSIHVLEMCMSVLELLVEVQNYSHITTYIFKADSALDGIPAQQSQQASAGPQTLLQAAKKSPEREKVQMKLDFCSALANLGLGSYEKAAQGFLKLGPKGLDDWFGKLVAPSDIAIYGVLCALATLPRSTLVTRLGLATPGTAKGSTINTEAPPFTYFLEQEQYIRELVDAYVNAKFKIVLDILERYSTRHLLDLHLYPHVIDLTTMIRNRALVLYFQPFTSIRLERMATAFGLPADDIERMVIALIQSGDIKGRVDSQAKILKAKELDQRMTLYTHAEKAGREIQSANRKLLLRIRLMQADLAIKNPKEPKGGSAGQAGGQMVLD